MACKPGSVPLAGGRPSISATDCSVALAVNPEVPAVRRSSRKRLECLPIRPCSRQSLPRFTPPLSRSSAADSSLWH